MPQYAPMLLFIHLPKKEVMKIGNTPFFFGWMRNYCTKTFLSVNMFLGIKEKRHRLQHVIQQNILSGKALDSAIFESLTIYLLNNGPVVGSVEMVDIIVDDHARGVFPGCFYTKIGVLLF